MLLKHESNTMILWTCIEWLCFFPVLWIEMIGMRIVNVQPDGTSRTNDIHWWEIVYSTYNIAFHLSQWPSLCLRDGESILDQPRGSWIEQRCDWGNMFTKNNYQHFSYCLKLIQKSATRSAAGVVVSFLVRESVWISCLNEQFCFAFNSYLVCLHWENLTGLSHQN